jgi:oxygen-independent coproporphyrinogen-3 oxidase
MFHGQIKYSGCLTKRIFQEPEEKLQLYIEGKDLLTSNHYADIGMDHFALPHDDLYQARQSGTLHRNFMGYTTQNTSLLVGLGVSAISDLGNAFAQNDKALHNYYESINEGRLPVNRGFFLNDEDIAFRKYIKGISCKGFVTFEKAHLKPVAGIYLSSIRVISRRRVIEI